MKTNTREFPGRVYLSRLIFYFLTSNVCILLYLNYSATKRKRKKREPVAFSGLWVGVAEGETKVWKQNNNDALDGREGRIKINSSFCLGRFTVRYYSLWEIVFLGTGLCVVGGVGQRRYKAEC